MVSGNYLPVRQAWLDSRAEPALEPELPIFDAHHHLWDRPGWRYLFDDLMADIRGSRHRIIGTAFMQCQAMYRANGPTGLLPVGETEFANGVAAMAASGRYGDTHVCAAIISHHDAMHRAVATTYMRNRRSSLTSIGWVATTNAESAATGGANHRRASAHVAMMVIKPKGAVK